MLAEAERKKGGGGRRRKRKVITGGAYRWPKNAPVSYSFRESDGNALRHHILTFLSDTKIHVRIDFREMADIDTDGSATVGTGNLHPVSGEWDRKRSSRVHPRRRMLFQCWKNRWHSEGFHRLRV